MLVALMRRVTSRGDPERFKTVTVDLCGLYAMHCNILQGFPCPKALVADNKDSTKLPQYAI